MMRSPSPGDRLVPTGAPPPERPRRGGPPGARPPRFGLVRRLAGAVLAVLVLAGGVTALVAWRAFENLSQGLPTVAGLRDYHPSVMSRVYDGDDHLVAELATERRIFVPYAAIPDRVKNAFTAAEDQNFWTHNGVDPMAILRAGFTDLENLHSGRRPIGASTITQQVAKNMILGNVVTMQRKVKEAILAMRIEQTLSKEKILEIYLNEIYLGLGAYGIASAAQTYFDRPLDELTIGEAAFLAALPKGPNNYNPYRYAEAARSRRDWVIDRMVDTHAITRAEAREAKAEPLVPSAAHRAAPVPGADWFTGEVHKELADRFGIDEINSGGLTVQTSLDPRLQTLATDALRRGLIAYDRSHGTWRGPVTHLDGFAPVEVERHRRVAMAVAAAAPDWAAALTRIPRPPGMLPHWTLGVVLSETPTTARIGWLDEPGEAAGPPAASHVSPMEWGDSSWARTDRGPPRRMADIVKPGDVVMVELTDAGAASERMVLRQEPKVEGALVSLDPTSGRVLALVGGWSYENSQFNRATQAERQPGSSFKPFVYLAAMERGISPSQQFLDGPFSMGNWRPENYEMDYNGMTALHDALRQSLNLVTIRLASHIGMTAVADTAIAFHEVDTMPKVLPAALGAVDTTVLREAGAYASLAENGREVVPSLIDSVEDRDGHEIWHPGGFALAPGTDPAAPPGLVDDRKQIADAPSDFQVVQMMQDVVKRGTGTPAAIGLDRPIAGKTGTSQDFNDAWFVGFTPQLVTAVWVGFDQPSSLGDKETGGAVAAPIWNQFMKQAIGDSPVLQFRVPDGITLARYNTGMGTTVDAFKDGQVPGQSSGLGAGAAVDANSMTLGPEDTGAEVDANIPPPESGGGGTISASSGDASRPAAAAPARASAAGSDIGVGGVY